MKPAVRIVTWYALLVTPMIAVLYVNGSILSATMAIVAMVVISIISFQDIAEIVRHNRSQAERILGVTQMKKDFISHVSHELKAPLASMQETTQLMLERIPGPLTDKQERLLNLNLQSGKRLAVMIGNLLDISRLEAGVVEYEMQVQDVAEIAESVIVEHSRQAQEKSVRIVTDIAREPLMVNCDSNRVVQIFSNLLDNAVRFSAKGGTVTVSLRAVKTPPQLITHSVTSDGGYILLAIGDAGPGIEGPHKKAVFDTFHQIRQGKKTWGQSLGLGLAISRALVEAHRGAIWVEDNPGGGSVFFVLMPKAKHEVSAMSKAS
jgi:signal transduction histidine kinase